MGTCGTSGMRILHARTVLPLKCSGVRYCEYCPYQKSDMDTDINIDMDIYIYIDMHIEINAGIDIQRTGIDGDTYIDIETGLFTGRVSRVISRGSRRVASRRVGPDPTRPDPTRPDPTRPDPTRPDPTRPARCCKSTDPTRAGRATTTNS